MREEDADNIRPDSKDNLPAAWQWDLHFVILLPKQDPYDQYDGNGKEKVECHLLPGIGAKRTHPALNQ